VVFGAIVAVAALREVIEVVAGIAPAAVPVNVAPLIAHAREPVGASPMRLKTGVTLSVVIGVVEAIARLAMVAPVGAVPLLAIPLGLALGTNEHFRFGRVAVGGFGFGRGGVVRFHDDVSCMCDV
jgi:hypothetical protein